MDAEFWTKKLTDLTEQEWEALCDGCGLCCLHTLEDVDSGCIAVTKVKCEQLDEDSCRCTNYDRREALVADCVALDAQNVFRFRWLPDTCAYRRVAERRPLPYWHYLISGDKSLVHRLDVSAKQYRTRKMPASEADLQASIIRWVD